MVPRERNQERAGRLILGIIPARGGSKRIPRKNLVSLCGRPLIAYSIEAAQCSKLLTRTVVSTEDKAIHDVAVGLDADVPFLRPAELSTDSTPSEDVVLHALGEIEKSEARQYDYVCILEPTAPLRTSEDVDAALELLISSESDSVIGLTPVIYFNPARLRIIRDNRVYLWAPELWKDGRRRQDLEGVFRPAGGLFACRRDVIVQKHSLYGPVQCGYVFPEERAIDIDTSFDLSIAEFFMRRRDRSG